MGQVPVLLSVWVLALSLNGEFSLPECLSQLPPGQEGYLRNQMWILMEDYPLCTAACTAWMAFPEHPGNLMISCHFMRGMTCNSKAHPIPSISFASDYFSDPNIPLNPTLRNLASCLIHTAALKPLHGNNNINYVYEDTNGDQDKYAPETWEDIFAEVENTASKG